MIRLYTGINTSLPIHIHTAPQLFEGARRPPHGWGHARAREKKHCVNKRKKEGHPIPGRPYQNHIRMRRLLLSS